jgi:hypothetical protein
VGTKTATSDSFDDGCDGSSSEIFNACSLYEPVAVAESNMNFDGRSCEERQTEKGGKRYDKINGSGLQCVDFNTSKNYINEDLKRNSIT